MRIGILSFYVGSRKHKFKQPLLLDVLEGEAIEGGMCVSHKELGLSACGPSWAECREIILGELEALWDGYVLAPEDELSTSGIALKNKLQGMVRGRNRRR